MRSRWGVFLALKLARGGGVAFLQDAVVGQTRNCRIGVGGLNVVQFARRKGMDDGLRATQPDRCVEDVCIQLLMGFLSLGQLMSAWREGSLARAASGRVGGLDEGVPVRC